MAEDSVQREGFFTVPATCPRCGQGPDRSYGRDELARQLKEGSVKTWCIRCDHSWTITDPEELRRISEHIKDEN